MDCATTAPVYVVVICNDATYATATNSDQAEWDKLRALSDAEIHELYTIERDQAFAGIEELEPWLDLDTATKLSRKPRVPRRLAFREKDT